MNNLGYKLDCLEYKENALAEQSRAEQSRAEQSRAEQSRAEQSRAEQSRITLSFFRLVAVRCLKLHTTFVMDNRRILTG